LKNSQFEDKIARERKKEREIEKDRERERSPSIVGVFLHFDFESSSTCRVSFSTRKIAE
jgi:hypothetical protein